jgi:hypothetical protein
MPSGILELRGNAQKWSKREPLSKANGRKFDHPFEKEKLFNTWL